MPFLQIENTISNASEDSNGTVCVDQNQNIDKSTSITAVLTTMTVLGLVANIITLIILILYEKDFPQISRTLLKNQATSDCFVCVMAVGLYFQSFRWTTGFRTFDLLLCQTWHSQALFWGGVHVSIWSLVFIAVERFVKISYPFKHRRIRKSHIYTTCTAIYFSSFVFTFPCYFQTRYDMETGKCLDQYYFQTNQFHNLMAQYGIFWFVMEYVIPTTLFISIYTKVILDLRSHKKNRDEIRCVGSLQRKKQCTLSLADKQLTKTSIFVTIVFVISLGVESWRYFLGRIGIICYEKNTLQLILGVFLASINSCANPFIYSISLPVFKKCLKKMFHLNSC